ncbi:uncharacterized protein LOC124932561 [Impatiens glandulifera]|uniref:uncharacterized protein LOC124932561 n=1 Tax=Impatiens glandulifera TaxID=253017 RepID=UPI001FB1574E|nr:uncharacterized protein LOC124932561 [Impatiens glandulifera]
MAAAAAFAKGLLSRFPATAPLYRRRRRPSSSWFQFSISSSLFPIHRFNNNNVSAHLSTQVSIPIDDDDDNDETSPTPDTTSQLEMIRFSLFSNHRFNNNNNVFAHLSTLVSIPKNVDKTSPAPDRTKQRRKPMCLYHTQGKCTMMDDPLHIEKFDHNCSWKVKLVEDEMKNIRSQQLDYFLVLNFEGKDEMLGFPVLMIDAKTLEVVDLFHRFVRPLAMTEESIKDCSIEGKYGAKVGGVHGVWHKTAIPFKEVIEQFEVWMVQHGLWKREIGGCLERAAFVTCGNWNLNTKIPQQCKVSGMNLPEYFTEWINLKVIFLYFHKIDGISGNITLDQMMKKLRLPMLGSYFLGIDNTKNIVTVLQRMILNGARIQITARRKSDQLQRVEYPHPSTQVSIPIDDETSPTPYYLKWRPMCLYHTQGKCSLIDDPLHIKKFDDHKRSWKLEQVKVEAELKNIRSQQFDYFLVLDFEGKHEIHEFPVMMIDAKTLEIVDLYHRFVRPLAMTEESIKDCSIEGKYGAKVGGVHGVWHKTAIPFKEVIEQFEVWMVQHGLWKREIGGCLERAAFVTCGNWDLKTKVPQQCKVLEMKLPEYFMEWINLKDVFLNFYKRRAPGMVTMMKELELPLMGSHHLGIDDTKNIAKVLQHMLIDGALIQITARRNSDDLDNVEFLFKNRIR